MIQETSILTYRDITEEGLKDTWQIETFRAIKENPYYTAREYFELILREPRERIFPRITELKQMGLIIEHNKRVCSIGKRKALTYVVKLDHERNIVKRLGFKEIKKDIFIFYAKEGVLFQDFRGNYRNSYALDNNEQRTDFSKFEIHKTLKRLLNNG